MAKRGRKPLNDPDSKTFTVSELSIAPKVTAMEKDMYGNWLYWDGTATYYDPKAQQDATLPKGRRAAKFAVISGDGDDAYTLRFDMTGHLDNLERRSKKG